MQVHLAYGGTSLSVDFPANASVDEFAASAVDAAVGYAEFFSQFAASRAKDFLAASSLLFIVNDGYRHTPTAQVLDWLDEAQPDLLDRAHFLIATGTHKPPKDEHYRSIFGKHLDRLRRRVYYHVCTDTESMQKVGVDSFGAEVFANSLIFQFDRLVIIGSVEPHYFAGYTGGRKALFPGLADLATTERNHNLANSLEAQPLRLKGNPVAEHLQSLLPLLKAREIISIQLVADSQHRIGALFLGDLENSFTRAVEYAEHIYGRPTTGRYDLVLCEILPPLDKNMYQAQKALENCQSAVADGGTLVVIAACEEGIGSDFFFQEAQGWDEVNNRPGDGIYRFGSHKLTRMILHQRRIDVCLKSNLQEQTVRAVYYKPVNDLNELCNVVLNGPGCRAAVVHDAGHTVLRTTS